MSFGLTLSAPACFKNFYQFFIQILSLSPNRDVVKDALTHTSLSKLLHPGHKMKDRMKDIDILINYRKTMVSC